MSAAARGDVIGVMIDGARIVTPRLLHFARTGARMFPRAVVASLGWYLGFDHQRWAIEGGYNAAHEDALLASIAWPEDGYRLFEIATLDGSSIDGWFTSIAKSNSLFLRRDTWDLLTGAEEKFDQPGGGLLNLDTFRRAVELPESRLVVMLGEGTFHQMHGGIATNSKLNIFSAAIANWKVQYAKIRGRELGARQTIVENRTYIGTLPRAALVHFVKSAVEPVLAGSAPLGHTFDRTLWKLSPSPMPVDPTVAALVGLAENEFRARRLEAAAAVARIARARAPDEPAPQHLLVHAGASLRSELPPDDRRAHFHLARARAYRLIGDNAAAAAEFHAVLGFDPDEVQAHVGLAELKLPGDGYLAWLTRLHLALVPETYLEIGTARGQSLAHAQPPTRAIAVDPSPMPNIELKTETHIFCETSDAFFAKRRLNSLLVGRPLGMAFIDGLHTFQQSLKDFINIEAFCGPRSVVLFHDTIPLDEVTQRPKRERKFYTGDVWKTVVCLKRRRPDLDVFTVRILPGRD